MGEMTKWRLKTASFVRLTAQIKRLFIYNQKLWRKVTNSDIHLAKSNVISNVWRKTTNNHRTLCWQIICSASDATLWVEDLAWTTHQQATCMWVMAAFFMPLFYCQYDGNVSTNCSASQFLQRIVRHSRFWLFSRKIWHTTHVTLTC